MPIYTNTTGLPQPIVDAVIKDPYTPGECDLTVTQLISPPRKVALERKHSAEITEDVSDRLWALLGQLGHAILERSANSGIIEKRWYGAMDGWVIGGRCDIVLSSQIIVDYKFCSVWAAKDGVKPEWEQQVNLLAWLAAAHAFPIVEGQIVCIFRDWSVLQARREPDYPQKQVKVLPVPIWDFDKQQEFCRQRVAAHASAQQGTLPECTSEERWERSPKWAVMKKGRKRAVRLYDTEAEALKHEASERGTYIEHRPGESIRCQAYCNAAPFCEQWKKMGGATQLTELTEAEFSDQIPDQPIVELPIPEMPEIR